MSLSFDAELHRYAWNGVTVPSVTQLLQPLVSYTGIDPAVLEAAQDRGSDVHEACHLFELEMLDEEYLRAESPYILGYVEGWKAFIRDCAPVWTRMETPLYHPVHRFAGTPDREGGFLYGGVRVTEATLDIKTGTTSHPAWGLQTAGYRLLSGASGRRFTVQLGAGGTYKILEWTDPTDLPAFLSLRTLHTWRERHRL